MKNEGYKFVTYLEKGMAVFEEKENGIYEVFVANKNHASWGFHWNNTDWEFVRNVVEEDKYRYSQLFEIL